MTNDTLIQCLFLTYHKIEKTKSLITLSVIVSVWNGILFGVALVANGLVCTAILKHRELRVRASNTLLLLLSMSDFCVAFAVQPLYPPTIFGAARTLPLLGNALLQGIMASFDRDIFSYSVFHRVRKIYRAVLHVQVQRNHHSSKTCDHHWGLRCIMGNICDLSLFRSQHSAILHSSDFVYHHVRHLYHFCVHSHL